MNTQPLQFPEKEDKVSTLNRFYKLQTKDSINNFMVFMKRSVREHPKQYISYFAKNTRSLNNLLNTSKGRDKFCQLIQYTANLYVTTMKHSEVYADLVKHKEVLSVRRAKSIEDNISNGRKIFRLLLFLNEIGELNSVIKNNKMKLRLKILKIMSLFCSFNYYLFDNIVWLSTIGIVNKFILPQFKWKKLKDIFSLWKTILEVIISIYQVVLKTHKEKELMEQLEYDQDKVIKQSQKNYVIMRNLILIRRKIRFLQMEVFIYVMRMIMLTSSLKLIGHKYLDPIFVSACGLIQAVSVVFKSMKGKKKFCKLSFEDIQKQNNGSSVTLKKTMILSQVEFNKVDKKIQGQLQDQQNKILQSQTGKIHLVNTGGSGGNLVHIEDSELMQSQSTSNMMIQNQSLQCEDVDNLMESNLNLMDTVNEENSNSNEDDQQKQYGLEEPEEEEDQQQEEQKIIDDVYDCNAFKPEYLLQSLRKGYVMDYSKLMEMIDQHEKNQPQMQCLNTNFDLGQF